MPSALLNFRKAVHFSSVDCTTDIKIAPSNLYIYIFGCRVEIAAVSVVPCPIYFLHGAQLPDPMSQPPDRARVWQFRSFSDALLPKLNHSLVIALERIKI